MAQEKSPIVELAAIIVGVFMIISIGFLLSARSDLDILVPIAWSFVFISLIFGLIQYQLLRKK